MFPGEHHILDISELTYKNLNDKSVFDYLNKKQTIDGWSNKSHSIATFVTKYRDLLYQIPLLSDRVLLLVFLVFVISFLLFLSALDTQ